MLKAKHSGIPASLTSGLESMLEVCCLEVSGSCYRGGKLGGTLTTHQSGCHCGWKVPVRAVEVVSKVKVCRPAL